MLIPPFPICPIKVRILSQLNVASSVRIAGGVTVPYKHSPMRKVMLRIKNRMIPWRYLPLMIKPTPGASQFNPSTTTGSSGLTPDRKSALPSLFAALELKNSRRLLQLDKHEPYSAMMHFVKRKIAFTSSAMGSQLHQHRPATNCRSQLLLSGAATPKTMVKSPS